MFVFVFLFLFGLVRFVLFAGGSAAGCEGPCFCFCFCLTWFVLFCLREVPRRGARALFLFLFLFDLVRFVLFAGGSAAGCEGPCF